MNGNDFERLKAYTEDLAGKHGLKVAMHLDHSGAVHIELTQAQSHHFLSLKDASQCPNFAEAKQFINWMLDRASANVAH